MMRSADNFFFFRCRELEKIQWKFQKPVQGSIQSIQMSPLWAYIQRLWWRLQRKRAKRCDAGVLWLWWLHTAETTVSMRLEEASNVSSNVFLMFELATFIAYFILLDSLFFTITLSRECCIYQYSFSSYWLQYLYGQ